MKASLQLKEARQNHNQDQKPCLRLKIPITILNLPFISSFTASDSSDVSFNLRTNNPSFPSLTLSYSPTTTTTTTTTNSPLSLTLKSGVGLFGSPSNSPLLLSAQFNLLGNPNPSPTFSLQFNPQFGNFSLKKTAVSDSLPNPLPHPPKPNGAPERVLFRRELPEPDLVGDGFLSGVAVTAKTALPVGRRAVVKFRWGVGFPAGFEEGRSLPVLMVDKVSVERVEEEKNVVKREKESVDLEVLKGMCGWMRREVEDLQRENRELRESLEGLRLGSVKRTNGQESDNVGGKLVSPSSENSGEFDRWRSKKIAREENLWREAKKSGGFEVSKDDVGEELKKAIKAASISGT